MMSSQFESNAGRYVQDVNAALLPGTTLDRFVARKAELVRSVVRHRFDDATPCQILDLGCGTGLLHARFDEPSEAVIVGVDPALAALRQARAANPHALYAVYDGQVLPFQDETFDLGLAVCVLHHVFPSDRLALLEELRRVLRIGGTSLLIEHNPFNLFTRWVVSRCEFDRDASLLSAGTTRDLLSSAGFSDPAIQFFQFTPWTGVRARALDRYLTWLPIGAQYAVSATRGA